MPNENALSELAIPNKLSQKHEQLKIFIENATFLKLFFDSQDSCFGIS